MSYYTYQVPHRHHHNKKSHTTHHMGEGCLVDLTLMDAPYVASSASVLAWSSIAGIMQVHLPQSPLLPLCHQPCFLLTSSRNMWTEGNHNRSLYKFHQSPTWGSIEFIGLIVYECGLTDRRIDNSKATASLKKIHPSIGGWLTRAASLGFSL